MAEQPLFNDFDSVSKSVWREKVEKDLKGATYDEKLRFRRADGYELEGLYHAEEKSGWQTVEHTLRNDTLNREQPALGARNWDNQPLIRLEENHESALNEHALEALQNGADGLLLDLRDCAQPPRWERMLKSILLPHCRISFWFPDSVTAAEWFQTFVQYVETVGIAPAEVRGSLLGIHAAQYAELQALAAPFVQLRTPVVELPNDATPADQIVAALQELVRLADAHTPTEVWQRVGFFVPLGHDYFESIAKLRALRFLLIQLGQLYELEERIPLHAYTHHAAVSLPDADTHFLISNTTQAMAGILGGATALTVLPHQKDRTFAHRIARNVSSMLREEAYLEKVADPVAGAYYIEKHTDALARAAWEQFRKA